ncbi:MAG: DUF721 domain-containing protein [Flavobacteriaceae bacterium]
MNRKEGHQSLKQALNEFIESNKLQKGMDQIRVSEVWKASMGPGVSKYTTSVQLKGDTLYISLSSSVLREELSLGRTKIIDLLNEALGKELIQRLILR